MSNHEQNTAAADRRTQFPGESILLAVIGGVVGVLAGAIATVIYASSKNWVYRDATLRPRVRGELGVLFCGPLHRF